MSRRYWQFWLRYAERSNPGAFLTYIVLSSYKAETTLDEKSLIAAILPAYRNDLVRTAIAVSCVGLAMSVPACLLLSA